MRIFLVGFMGSGKSYTGKLLAQKSGFPLIDLDQWIETKYQTSISEIFSSKGEDKFREIEKDALHEMAAFDNVIVACGGGTPCYYDNMAWMKKNGITVYLKASPALLAERLEKERGKRPLLSNLNTYQQLLAFIKNKLEERVSYYGQADLIIDQDDPQFKSDDILYKTIFNA